MERERVKLIDTRAGGGVRGGGREGERGSEAEGGEEAPRNASATPLTWEGDRGVRSSACRMNEPWRCHVRHKEYENNTAPIVHGDRIIAVAICCCAHMGNRSVGPRKLM